MLEALGKELVNIFKESFKSVSTSAFKESVNFFKGAKEAFKNKEAIKGVGGIFKGLGTMALGPLTMVLSVLDALGIAEPILNAFSSILTVIGGSIMQSLMPAIQNLFNILFSPEMMELWMLLGEIIGAFLKPIINAFAITLEALAPVFEVLKDLFVVLEPVIIILAKAIGTLMIVSIIPLVWGIYAVGVAIAFLLDLFTLWTQGYVKKWNEYFLPVASQVTSGAMQGIGKLWAMQQGGYVGPSAGGTIVKLGEGREGEFVVPESKAGSIGLSQEILWATEDNGKKLDILILEISRSNRYRRLG